MLDLICRFINDGHIKRIEANIEKWPWAFKREWEPSLNQHCGYLDVVSRHAAIYEVVLEHDHEWSGDLTGFDRFEGFLDGNFLKIDEFGASFDLFEVAVEALFRDGRFSFDLLLLIDNAFADLFIDVWGCLHNLCANRGELELTSFSHIWKHDILHLALSAHHFCLHFSVRSLLYSHDCASHHDKLI